MRILITGNMGYVGPRVSQELRTTREAAELVGFDNGYFASCLTNASVLPEVRLNAQHFGDVRRFPSELLKGVDAVVYLAAISNDPMGKAYEEVTMDINCRAAIALGREAKRAGARAFVFASSCSVYGFAADGARDETSPVDPLTAYARSKVEAERGLAVLADKAFRVTCLRFATACGMSTRLRLDLVVNDFVASAIAGKKITILSDGTPWRPLIHVQDMARAIDWAIDRDASGGDCLIVNTGSNAWNYQVKALAEAVEQAIPGIDISVNTAAPPDKRSYRVDFGLFEKLAPRYQPKIDLAAAIQELKSGLEQMGFRDSNFRSSNLIRLNTLAALRQAGYLDQDLRWARV